MYNVSAFSSAPLGFGWVISGAFPATETPSVPFKSASLRY